MVFIFAKLLWVAKYGTIMDPFVNGHPTYVNWSAFVLTSLNLRGNFVDDEPTHEWASIFNKILWVLITL